MTLEKALMHAPGGADALRGRLLLDLARARVRDWDARALPAARRGVDLVAHVAELEPADLLTLADACLLRRLPEALDRYREAASRGAGGDVACAAACGEAQALDALGHPHEAVLAAQVAEALARELGLPDRRAQARWLRLRIHLGLRGPSPEILTALDAVIREAGDADWTELARVDRAVGLADAGRTREAQLLIDRVLARPRTAAARQAARWALAELEWLTGRPDRAAAEAEALLERWPESPVRGWAELTLAWAIVDEGGAPRPSSIRFLDAPPGLDDAAAGTALVAGGPEDCERAERHLRRAAEKLATRTLREALRSLLGAAHAAERCGARERAARLRTAVAARAAKAGYAVLAARATRSELARDGAPDSPATALTATERAVLALVAKGLTSREIADRRGVSRTTVESQVRSAMSKLGARTRLEAAARVVEPVAEPGPSRRGVDPEALQMLALVASGVPVDEIAARTAYSPRTVARRLADARKALGTRTTAQAVALARAHGLLDAVDGRAAGQARGG